MTEEVYRWPKGWEIDKKTPEKNYDELVRISKELEEINKKIKEYEDFLGKMKEIVMFNFEVTKGLMESMSKLVKMLCDPNYGTNYLYDKDDKEKEIKEKQ